MDRWIEEWCNYDFATESFHIKKLCSRLFGSSWILLAKTTKTRFVPPFGGLEGNMHGLSMARWKVRGRLAISANWTFSPALTAEALWANMVKTVVFERGGLLWEQISGGKRVVHQRLLASENYSPWTMTWCCLRDLMFSRFDTIPACDRHTHTHTHADRQTHDDG